MLSSRCFSPSLTQSCRTSPVSSSSLPRRSCVYRTWCGIEKLFYIFCNSATLVLVLTAQQCCSSPFVFNDRTRRADEVSRRLSVHRRARLSVSASFGEGREEPTQMLYSGSLQSCLEGPQPKTQKQNKKQHTPFTRLLTPLIQLRSPRSTSG
jgi:hypothetical protein